MPAALLKFQQGALVGGDGLALFVPAGAPVTAKNVVDTSVVEWTFTVIDVPPGSSVPTGIVQDGATPTWTFTPDVPGGYLIQLGVKDVLGVLAVDLKCVGVKNASGRFVPPFDAPGSALNFANNSRGWSTHMEAWLTRVENSTRVFNVMAYGAVGDGVADDTAAIQAAIADKEAALGGILFFPSGNFKVSSSIDFGKYGITQGSGWSQNNFTSTTTSPGTYIRSTVAAGNAFTLGSGTTLNNIAHRLCDLALVQASATVSSVQSNTATGLNLNAPGTYTSLVIDNVFLAGWNIAFDPRNAEELTTNNLVMFYNNTGQLHVVGSGNSQITNSQFYGTIAQNNGLGVDIQAGSGIKFFGGVVQGNRIGVRIKPNTPAANPVLVEQVVLDGTWFERNFFPIITTSNNGGGLIRVNCPNHGLVTGTLLGISLVVGSTNANGSFVISVIDANNFDLQGSVFDAPGTGGQVDTGLVLDVTNETSSTEMIITNLTLNDCHCANMSPMWVRRTTNLHAATQARLILNNSIRFNVLAFPVWSQQSVIGAGTYCNTFIDNGSETTALPVIVGGQPQNKVTGIRIGPDPSVYADQTSPVTVRAVRKVSFAVNYGTVANATVAVGGAAVSFASLGDVGVASSATSGIPGGCYLTVRVLNGSIGVDLLNLSGMSQVIGTITVNVWVFQGS